MSSQIILPSCLHHCAFEFISPLLLYIFNYFNQMPDLLACLQLCTSHYVDTYIYLLCFLTNATATDKYLSLLQFISKDIYITTCMIPTNSTCRFEVCEFTHVKMELRACTAGVWMLPCGSLQSAWFRQSAPCFSSCFFPLP